MISQGFGEVSGVYFSPEGPNGAAGQHYIIALPYQASRSGEIKSSMPCSRDTMNSRNRLVKRINPSHRITESQSSGGKTQSNPDSPKEKRFCFPWEAKGDQFVMGIH